MNRQLEELSLLLNKRLNGVFEGEFGNKNCSEYIEFDIRVLPNNDTVQIVSIIERENTILFDTITNSFIDTIFNLPKNDFVIKLQAEDCISKRILIEVQNIELGNYPEEIQLGFQIKLDQKQKNKDYTVIESDNFYFTKFILDAATGTIAEDEDYNKKRRVIYGMATNK